MPAAENYLKRAANKGSVGMKIIGDHNELRSKWNDIKIAEVKTENIEHGYSFTATVFMNIADQNKILVELYAEGKDGKDPERIKMNLSSSNNGDDLYNANIITTKPAADHTIRIIPNYENISVPLENNLILWQH